MADEMDTTRFMPPFTTHICDEPTLTRARESWIVSHSVPPFYMPIPEDDSPAPGNVLEASETIPFFGSISVAMPAIPGHGWMPDGLKRAGWAGVMVIFFFLLFLAYGNLPNRWYHVLYVYSGSMAPAINPGDVIIITPPTQKLEPGMVLTMRVDGQLVTHRLVEIRSDGAFITKGDANNAPDSWDQDRLEIGGVVRARIPFLGYLAQVSQIFNRSISGGWYVDAHEIDMAMSSGVWVLEPTLPPAGLRGTSIQADVTVAGVCLPSDTILPDGSSAGMPKCVDIPAAAPTAMDNEDVLNAFGDVCITNNGEIPTSDLKVNFQVQYKPHQGPYIDMPGADFEFIPAEQLQPSTTRCYPYRVGFQPLDGVEQYKIIANVTITNHSGHIPGSRHCPGSEFCPFGPSPKASFSIQAEGEKDNKTEYTTGEEILNLQTPLPIETATPSEMPLLYIPDEEPTQTPDPQIPADAVVEDSPML